MVSDGVVIECLVSLWQLTVFFSLLHSWVHTERRTWSVFISGMEHGDIHITGLMCPKRLACQVQDRVFSSIKSEAH